MGNSLTTRATGSIEHAILLLEEHGDVERAEEASAALDALLAELEQLRAESAGARLHISKLLEIADLALYYAPGEIGEGFEQANGAVIRARAFLANEK